MRQQWRYTSSITTLLGSQVAEDHPGDGRWLFRPCMVVGGNRGTGRLREGDEMKALGLQRERIVLCYFLSLLFMAAFFVERHTKVHMGVMLPTGLAAALFMLAGLYGRYNLND